MKRVDRFQIQMFYFLHFFKKNPELAVQLLIVILREVNQIAVKLKVGADVGQFLNTGEMQGSENEMRTAHFFIWFFKYNTQR